MLPPLISIGALPCPFIRVLLSFSYSFLVEVGALCEKTGWLAARAASCVNSTKSVCVIAASWLYSFAFPLHLLL